MKNIKDNPMLVDTVAEFEASRAYDEAHIKGLSQFAAEIRKRATSLNQEEDSYELAKMQVELNDTEERIRLQSRVVADKLRHFNETFLPQYNERLIEVKANFDDLFAKVAAAVKDSYGQKLDGREFARVSRILKYYDEFRQLPKDVQAFDYVRANYYAVFKNLVGDEKG